jgi:hypothetical protein
MVPRRHIGDVSTVGNPSVSGMTVSELAEFMIEIAGVKGEFSYDQNNSSPAAMAYHMDYGWESGLLIERLIELANSAGFVVFINSADGSVRFV